MRDESLIGFIKSGLGTGAEAETLLLSEISHGPRSNDRCDYCRADFIFGDGATQAACCSNAVCWISSASD